MVGEVVYMATSSSVLNDRDLAATFSPGEA